MFGFFRILMLGIFASALCLPLYARELKKQPRLGPPSYEDLQKEVKASAALLVDAATGKILYERNAGNRYLPASTTKLMTALLVYERMGLNGAVIVAPEDTRVEPSNIPLRAGEKVSVSDMMHALLIGSDNDCALALAHKVAGSEDKFVEMMNLRSQQLGCIDTHFSNPNGLTERDPQYTTAHDLLKIFEKVISFPELREIMRTKHFTLQTRIGIKLLKNHNKLLGKYLGMDSAKTGWTIAAKHTYAAAAARDGRELHLILLHSPNKWVDARLLFDYGFANLPPLSANTATIAKNDPPPAPSTPPPSQPQPPQPAPTPAPPTQPPTPTTVAANTPAPSPETKEKEPTNAPAPTRSEKPEPAAKKSSDIISYTVQSGDTLAIIASHYKCTVKDILKHNRGLKPKHLRPGQTIYIPAQQ